MPGRALHFREFRLARRGHPLAECQDAAAADPERGRFAVADGAAESSLAAPWARLLVEDFVGAPGPPAEVPAAGALRHEGEFSPGDRAWLMTDALAQWFLAEAEKGGTPWDDLGALPAAPDPDAAFAAWVEGLRAARRLRNDDVTLLI